jgi:hypothetical protein
MPKLKPILVLAAAGGVVVALRKRAGAKDSQPDSAPSYAARAVDDNPQGPVTHSAPAEDLQTKAHDLPADTVMPDTSNDDPSVQEAENAAAADAAAIGRKGDETQP